MPQVDLIPMMVPLSEEEIIGRVRAGWRIIGQQVMRKSGLVTPDNPDGIQAIPVNIWFLPEPMVPVSLVIQAVVSASETFGEFPSASSVVGFFSQMILGASPDEVLEIVKAAQETEVGDEKSAD